MGISVITYTVDEVQVKCIPRTLPTTDMTAVIIEIFIMNIIFRFLNLILTYSLNYYQTFNTYILTHHFLKLISTEKKNTKMCFKFGNRLRDHGNKLVDGETRI